MQDKENSQQGFARNALKQSGVVEYCPHESIVLTGKSTKDAYALAIDWFNKGERGADEFDDADEGKAAVEYQLQQADDGCHICKDPK